MHAVVVHEFGPFEAASIEEVATPEAGPSEVLVEVHATAANFVDLITISGKYQFAPKLPFIPGKGPAGTVTAVGSQVTDLSPGDRVLAMAEYGGYAQFVAVAADQCYRLPDSLSFTDAAAMALAYDTAWFALHERAQMLPTDRVLVLGASGAVGQAAVQLAKAAGATVFAGLNSPTQAYLVPTADAIIDLSVADLRDNLRAQIYAVTNDQGVDVVLDPIGGDVFDAALRALAWRGRLVVIGFAGGRIPSLKANYLLLKNISVSGLQISDYRKRAAEQMARCFAEVFELYEAGKIKPAPSETLPISEFKAGLRQLNDRKVTGRMIFTQNP